MSDERLIAELAALRADFARANPIPVTAVDRHGFAGMSAADRMAFIQRGGKVTDATPNSTAVAATDLERHRRAAHEQREAQIRANLAAGLHVAPRTTAGSVEKALTAAARGDLAAARAMVADRAAAFEVLRSSPAVGRTIVAEGLIGDFDRSARFW